MGKKSVCQLWPQTHCVPAQSRHQVNIALWGSRTLPSLTPAVCALDLQGRGSVSTERSGPGAQRGLVAGSPKLLLAKPSPSNHLMAAPEAAGSWCSPQEYKTKKTTPTVPHPPQCVSWCSGGG